MANIKITELRPTGSELFQDSESFLNELDENETATILGQGYKRFTLPTFKSVFTKTLPGPITFVSKGGIKIPVIHIKF